MRPCCAIVLPWGMWQASWSLLDLNIKKKKNLLRKTKLINSHLFFSTNFLHKFFSPQIFTPKFKIDKFGWFQTFPLERCRSVVLPMKDGVGTNISCFRTASCFGSVPSGGFLELSSPNKGPVFLFTHFGKALRGKRTKTLAQWEAFVKPQHRSESLVPGGLDVMHWP